MEAARRFFFFRGASASSLSRLQDHTQTHHTWWDPFGRVFGPSKIPLPDNTQHSHKTVIHASGGIRTRNPSKRAVADTRRRLRGQWQQLANFIGLFISLFGLDIWHTAIKILSLFLCLFLARQPPVGQGLSYTRFLDHTQRRTTVGRRLDSYGRVIGPLQRPLHDNTQHPQQRDIHAPSGIRTHILSRRAAAGLRLRPRGHWDRQKYWVHTKSKLTVAQVRTSCNYKSNKKALTAHKKQCKRPIRVDSSPAHCYTTPIECSKKLKKY